MADLGAFRKQSRGILNENATTYRACRGYLTPLISAGRYHYLRDQFEGLGGGLNASSPAEGPAGATWSAVNFQRGGPLSVNNPTIADAHALINAGSADGFLSVTVNSSGNVNEQPMTLAFRCTAGTGWTNPDTLRRLPTQGWAVVMQQAGGSAQEVALYRNGVFVVGGLSGGTVALAAAGSYSCEVRLNGSNIQVWMDGVRAINVTDATHQTETHIGFARRLHATNPASTMDELFFAPVPTLPGGVEADGGNWASSSLNLATEVEAGSLLPCHFRWMRRGATGSTAANSAFTHLYDDAGTLITNPVPGNHSISGNYGYLAPATVGVYLTSTGLSGGAARVGTFRFRVGQQQTAGLAATQWTTDSENLASSPPSGIPGATTDFGRGYATVPVAISSIQRPVTLMAYNEVATDGLTLATQPLRASATPTISLLQGGVAVPSKGGAGSTWSGGASSRNDTIDKNFLRSASGVQLRITLPTQAALNNDLIIQFATPAPDGFDLFTSLVETAGDTAWTSDPRLTLAHLLQLNDNAYGTPPLDKNVSPQNMLSSDIGYVAARVRNANGVGQNGIQWTRSLRDSGQQVADSLGDSVTTATRGGEAGWDPTLGTWSASKPGGGWIHKRTITSPSTATGADMLLNNDVTFVLLAPNPALTVVVGGGAYGAAADKDHWHPGEPLLVGLALVNTVTGLLVLPDADTPTVYIGRFNQTLGRAEYLDSDLSWQHLDDITGAYAWPLPASPGDPNVFVYVFADTSGFDTTDLHLIGNCALNSTPYSGRGNTPVLDTKNRHDLVEFDINGFLLGTPV